MSVVQSAFIYPNDLAVILGLVSPKTKCLESNTSSDLSGRELRLSQNLSSFVNSLVLEPLYSNVEDISTDGGHAASTPTFREDGCLSLSMVMNLKDCGRRVVLYE